MNENSEQVTALEAMRNKAADQQSAIEFCILMQDVGERKYSVPVACRFAPEASAELAALIAERDALRQELASIRSGRHLVYGMRRD
jgi:hypothetical protein